MRTSASGTVLLLSLAITLLAQDVTRAASPSQSSASDTQWQRYVRPNRAYSRAQKRPPFRMSDPVGLVESESVKQAQREAAEKLRGAIRRAHEARKRSFTIPPGEYRFAQNRGLRLEGYDDFTLEARGVTFWFERPSSMLAADPKGLELIRCRKLTIRGLHIDFDPPVFLQAEILAIEEDPPSYLVKIDRGFADAEMKGGSYFLYRRDGSWIPHGYLFYERSQRIEGRKHRVVLPDARVFQAHNQDAGVRERFGDRYKIGPGDYIVLPFRRGKGIFVHGCESCVFEDIDEYASPGMGILETQGKGGNVYRRVRIIPRPGTRRLHVCAADGFHNAQTERGPQLLECEITGTSDDFFNLHGHFGVVWRSLGGRRYAIGQANLGSVKRGETLTFYQHLSIERLGVAKIAGIEKLEGRELITACDEIQLVDHANRNYHVITLDRDLPLAQGTLVALDRFRSAGFLIKDCYFHDAMARSLINGAGDGAIVNNVIERSAWGLVIHYETWRYYEGPMPRNIRITGNVFRDIRDLLLPQHSTAIAVTMVPQDGGYLRKVSPLANIQITGNYIEDPGGFAIVLANTKGALIAGNTIVRPMARPSMPGAGLRSIQFNIGHPNYFDGKARKAAISLWSSRDVEVRDNRLVDPHGYCEHGLVQIGDHCERIRVQHETR